MGGEGKRVSFFFRFFFAQIANLVDVIFFLWLWLGWGFEFSFLLIYIHTFLYVFGHSLTFFFVWCVRFTRSGFASLYIHYSGRFFGGGGGGEQEGNFLYK